EFRQRLGRAVMEGLPLRLRGEEGVEQGPNLFLLERTSGRLLEDIAGEPETAHPQFVAVCLEEARERVDEVKQHVVHVEHQQRARVEREFLDLAQRFRIDAHVERSKRSSPKGRALSARSTEPGSLPLASENFSKVGSWAATNCRTPARKPGLAAARRTSFASMPLIARKRGSSSGSAAMKPSAATASCSAASRSADL